MLPLIALLALGGSLRFAWQLARMLRALPRRNADFQPL